MAGSGFSRDSIQANPSLALRIFRDAEPNPLVIVKRGRLAGINGYQSIRGPSQRCRIQLSERICRCRLASSSSIIARSRSPRNCTLRVQHGGCILINRRFLGTSKSWNPNSEPSCLPGVVAESNSPTRASCLSLTLESHWYAPDRESGWHRLCARRTPGVRHTYSPLIDVHLISQISGIAADVQLRVPLRFESVSG